MSSKMLKGILGVALTATMVVSTAVTAFASGVSCVWCKSDNVSETGREVDDCQFAGPDGHVTYYTVDYHCNCCGHSFDDDEVVYEVHSYEINYETGMLVCEECGDSYSWN